MMNDIKYRPTPEFRDRLEWEVLRSYRRAGRARSSLVSPRSTWVRAAAIVAVSIGIGTTAGLASAQISRSQEKDSLLAAARAEAMLAAMRRDIARAEADDVTRRVRAGVEDQQATERANAELRAMEMQLARIGLDMDEINASGRAPRDDLNAPLVNGRDFVKARIEAEASAAQQRLRAAEGNQGELERRARVGSATEIERLAGVVDVTRARAAMAVLAEKLRLRAEFVARNTPIDQLTRRLDRVQLQQDAVVAQQALALARARLELVEKQRGAGVANEVDVLRARLDVTQRNLELSRLATRLRDTATKPPSP
jgi:hypothetical protein